ncbi:MAG: hypothetical protein HY059_19330 [Proteobacteria bacterium]|nr:hypothetical protein [Pseudomonadota bacterium]
MDSEEAKEQVDKAALQILASSVGQILGEHSKIHQFVKLAAERPTTINIDRARRTFDALPVYQRKRVAETAEGVAIKQKNSMTMSSILNRLGGNAKPPLAAKTPPAAAPEAKKKSVKEVVWK